MKKVLEQAFPKLRGTPYKITSSATPFYNCIAWAGGESDRWWEPLVGKYWPPGVDLEYTLPAYVAAYATLGYVECSGGSVEKGYEKIVIYADADDVPKHAARQLPSGRWTSKLGSNVDVEHTLPALESKSYGRIKKFMKRPITAISPAP